MIQKVIEKSFEFLGEFPLSGSIFKGSELNPQSLQACGSLLTKEYNCDDFGKVFQIHSCKLLYFHIRP